MVDELICEKKIVVFENEQGKISATFLFLHVCLWGQPKAQRHPSEEIVFILVVHLCKHPSIAYQAEYKANIFFANS